MLESLTETFAPNGKLAFGCCSVCHQQSEPGRVVLAVAPMPDWSLPTLRRPSCRVVQPEFDEEELEQSMQYTEVHVQSHVPFAEHWNWTQSFLAALVFLSLMQSVSI